MLQLLKDVTSALDELTQQQLMLEMMVVKEGTFDLTEPKAWKRKIDDLKNLLEKFETVNENQSIIENILNKKYDHTFMQIQADQRRKSIEMLKNLGKSKLVVLYICFKTCLYLLKWRTSFKYNVSLY